MSLLISFQNIITPTTSIGQANFFSKSSQIVGSRRTSIVQRLASRSTTDNELQIQVHQHCNYKLHLVWHMFDKNNKNSVRCLERIFSEPKALNDFWNQLKDGAFEGLCDCVCIRFIEWMNDKIKPCFSEHSTLEQLRRYVFLRSWERSEEIQKLKRNYFDCICPVSSSYGIGIIIWDEDPDTAKLVRYNELFSRR
jgi:hypothetical protein